MRRLLLYLFILCSSVVCAQEQIAQPEESFPHHEISLNAGTPGLLNLRDGLTFYFQYLYKTSKTVNIGASVMYQKMRNRHGNGYNQTSAGDSFFFLINLRCDWVYKRSFRLYTRYALGMKYESKSVSEKKYIYSTNEDGDKARIAFHVCPIGMTFGNDLFFKLELLGIGDQGILDIGLGYRF